MKDHLFSYQHFHNCLTSAYLGSIPAWQAITLKRQTYAFTSAKQPDILTEQQTIIDVCSNNSENNKMFQFVPSKLWLTPFSYYFAESEKKIWKANINVSEFQQGLCILILRLWKFYFSSCMRHRKIHVATNEYSSRKMLFTEQIGWVVVRAFCLLALMVHCHITMQTKHGQNWDWKIYLHIYTAAILVSILKISIPWIKLLWFHGQCTVIPRIVKQR